MLKNNIIQYVMLGILFSFFCFMMHVGYTANHNNIIRKLETARYDRKVFEILKTACEHRGGIKNFRATENEVEVVCDYTSPGIRGVSEIYLYGAEATLEGNK